MKRVVAASASVIALFVGSAVGAAELPRKAAKPVEGSGDLAATRTITTEIKEHIFRAGLNYKFSEFGKAPVVTKY